ncbi:MAG: 23S rRNA (uracil(1939)-C(5))-methyltransferase RlmD [Oscillospiraceae bacterium]|nr:23S rRNA (uracil(1939)-C(5))-methyltransferase RlmD [Oscillospiraceae bacterium]
MDTIKKNKEYIVTIEAYNSEGSGVARIDGRAVFIPNALKGEVWHIKVLKVTAAAVYGKGLELLKRSSERCEPLCPIFSRCGGCSTWQMSYEEELRFKLTKVNDALQHIGRQTVTADEIISCENPLHYRNKGIFTVAEIDGHTCFGFFRERTHELVPVEYCLIQMPLGEKVSRIVCDFMNRNRIRPYHEEDGTGTVRHIFCRSAVCTKDAVACIISARGFGAFTQPLIEELRELCPELTGIVLCINKERGNAVLSGDYYTLYGSPDLTDYLGRNEFVISPQAFYQVNPVQAEKLYVKAVEYACRGKTDTVLELYCGAGTISMFLAEKFREVTATEIVPEAVQNAKANAERIGFSNITFLCGDAAQSAAQYRDAALQPNCIVVDPPRKGMDEEAVRNVASMAPDRIVYISCNPATLARDIVRFNSFGYVLEEAAAVDMFPKTFHVETVALLTRRKDEPGIQAAMNPQASQ